MFKRSVQLLIIAALGAGGWLGWKALNQKEEMEVRTTKAATGSLALSVSATGKLAPTTEVLIGCETSGTVESVLVEHNDRVKRGQELIRLKPELVQAELKQAEADVARIQAQLKQVQTQAKEAERQYQKAKSLQAGQAASPDELAMREAAKEAAVADVAAAEASVKGAGSRVDLAKYHLDRTVITSPIDGVVIDRRVDVGQTVAAAFMAPELISLAEDLSHMRLLADVSESDVGYICPGQAATFKVNAYRDRTFTGTVRQIRNQPKTLGNVVTYTVTIDVENREQLLRPGMPADVTIEIVQRENALKIANSALRFRPPLPPTEIRHTLDALKWPPAPASTPVIGRHPVETRPSEVSFTPPPLEPVKGTLWQYVNLKWQVVPVWTVFTDNRETIVAENSPVKAGDEFATEVRMHANGQSALQRAIMLARPENRQP
ncbi:MAG TPA: efflux RND transporter periplasmic adaptor subunit [Phycisphaerae bacterium]|nr:efflux RND transporter periplasmic adaptor subunit [Phycisphaerae bacterium]HRY67190.1 efflux RND transporter periplasmic adaptor subunit [Phycisphaerae bacterium]HSA26440.1 efflux RND transporter periplasmic adaptor subunit [Phycisphaerae bacterium]